MAAVTRHGRIALAFSLVVPPAAQTPVHDHLAWGLVGLYRGTQDEEIFVREEGGLRLTERRALRAGDFYALIPPRDDIHRFGRRPRKRQSRFTCLRTTPAASGGTRTTRTPAPHALSGPAT